MLYGQDQANGTGIRISSGSRHSERGMGVSCGVYRLLPILAADVCLVELRGLEPLTPCLQNTPLLPETTAGQAIYYSRWRLRTALAGSRCGQAWWSAFAA